MEGEKFTEELPSLDKPTYDTGVYIMDGVTKGVEDDAAGGRLAGEPENRSDEPV